MQMTFRESYSSLNPSADVGRILTEGRVAQGIPTVAARVQAAELIELLGLDVLTMERIPHEPSGGQRQRIARALASEPEIVIADEARSASDMQVQAQVLADLKARLNLSMLCITPDPRAASAICDCIVAGGPADRLLQSPETDYR